MGLLAIPQYQVDGLMGRFHAHHTEPASGGAGLHRLTFGDDGARESKARGLV